MFSFRPSAGLHRLQRIFDLKVSGIPRDIGSVGPKNDELDPHWRRCCSGWCPSLGMADCQLGDPHFLRRIVFFPIRIGLYRLPRQTRAQVKLDHSSAARGAGRFQTTRWSAGLLVATIQGCELNDRVP